MSLKVQSIVILGCFISNLSCTAPNASTMFAQKTQAQESIQGMGDGWSQQILNLSAFEVCSQVNTADNCLSLLLSANTAPTITSFQQYLAGNTDVTSSDLADYLNNIVPSRELPEQTKTMQQLVYQFNDNASILWLSSNKPTLASEQVTNSLTVTLAPQLQPHLSQLASNNVDYSLFFSRAVVIASDAFETNYLVPIVGSLRSSKTQQIAGLVAANNRDGQWTGRGIYLPDTMTQTSLDNTVVTPLTFSSSSMEVSDPFALRDITNPNTSQFIKALISKLNSSIQNAFDTCDWPIAALHALTLIIAFSFLSTIDLKTKPVVQPTPTPTRPPLASGAPYPVVPSQPSPPNPFMFVDDKILMALAASYLNIVPSLVLSGLIGNPTEPNCKLYRYFGIIAAIGVFLAWKSMHEN